MIIHLLATPLRYRSFGRDVDARFGMGGTQCKHIPAGMCFPVIGHDLPVGIRKPDRTTNIHCNAETTLVHQSVVVAAE